MKRSGFRRKKSDLKKTELKKAPFKSKTGIKPKPRTPEQISHRKRNILKKHKRKKASKGSPLWAAIKRADVAFSQMVRLLAANKYGICQCYTCTSKGFWKLDQIEAGHCIGRTNMQTRWFLPNVKCQCRKCNSLLGGNIEVFKRNLIKEYGEGIVTFLERESKKRANLTVQMLDNMTKHFESEVSRLKKQLEI